MPHRFKRSRKRCPHNPPCTTHCHFPLTYPLLPPDLFSSTPDMSHISSPSKALVRNPPPLTQHDARQGGRRNYRAWKSEIAGKIIAITDPVSRFLDHFVPGEMPSRSVTDAHFSMPSGATKESEFYGPLCDGFSSLVNHFAAHKRPIFLNHEHKRIDFPYALAAAEHHATKPDIIASFPGETSISRHADYWRNISLVVEVKLAESEDPMRSYSEAHERTLIQLAKSARNLLVSQSSLFVFTIGIYGSLARIFRFDHAGGICSSAFDYTTPEGSRLFHEFLWRFTHPLRSACRVVGADPTVTLLRPDDRATAVKSLRAAGVKLKDTDEASKAYRYFTSRGSGGRNKKYLAYHLIFINPHLFSRATTVWEAIEIGADGTAIGSPIVIKESWRQLARERETDNYIHIFHDTIAVNGIALFEGGEDLGRAEIQSLHRGNPGGREVGHLTVTARHFKRKKGIRKHAYNERSHSRIMLGTVGIPLSRFNTTKEMVRALRDAIRGHQAAFKAGVIHRDVSEGNIMICRDGKSRGFIQDFDYGMNWKALLADLGLDPELAEWGRFVKEELGKMRQDLVHEDNNSDTGGSEPGSDENEFESDDDDDDSSDENHDSSDDPSGEDSDEDENEHGEADAEDDGSSEVPEGASISDEGKALDLKPLSPDELRLKCKQRTGTLYFMAVDVIRGDVVHEVRHDLESFFWLLIWLVLRHTAHDDAQGNLACSSLFDGDTDAVCASRKSDFLARRKRLMVSGNGPLSRLINEFRKLCKYNDSSLSKFRPLTYARVLRLFKEALDSEDWPKNDRAKPFLLPQDDANDGASFPRRHESNIRSSQVASDLPDSREVRSASRAASRKGRTDGQPRRSAPPPAEKQCSTKGGTNVTTTASSSRSRKRSREQYGASDAGEGSKRTKTDSNRRRATARRKKRRTTSA